MGRGEGGGVRAGGGVRRLLYKTDGVIARNFERNPYMVSETLSVGVAHNNF